MSKIEHLTDEQHQLINVVGDEWMNRVFSCKTQLNKEEAENGINWIYEISNLKKPKIIWIKSPLGLQYCANIMLRDSVWASVWDSVWASVWDSVMDSVWDSVWASVWDSVMDSVWASVRDSVRDSVMDSVWASVRDSVRDSVVDSKLTFYDFTPYGSIQDYAWVSFCDFFHRVNIIQHKEFMLFRDFLKSGIYDMITLDGLCLVSEMPKRISRDEKGRLHSENSSCIEWSDGFKIWKWKGFDVPRKLIEAPDSVTIDDLRKNSNTELRRAFIEKLGVSRYFEILSSGEGLLILDEDIDNQANPMKLMSFLFEGEIIQVLECQCPSTGRVYNIYPPSQNCKNVWEAKADTFNISEKQIKLLTKES